MTIYLGGEYTGSGRDVDAILAEIGPHIDPDDFAHIRMILTEGFPSSFIHQESRENKMTLLRRGNQKSVLDYPDIVQKTMNKEERYSHVAPFTSWVFCFSWSEYHVPQLMVIKVGKNPSLVGMGPPKGQPRMK